MEMKIAGFFLGVADFEFATGGGEDRAGIADLAARLAVKRGLVDDDPNLVAADRFADPLIAFDDRLDHPFGDFGLIPQEFARADLVAQGKPGGFGRRLAGANPGGARTLARFLPLLIEFADI